MADKGGRVMGTVHDVAGYLVGCGLTAGRAVKRAARWARERWDGKAVAPAAPVLTVVPPAVDVEPPRPSVDPASLAAANKLRADMLKAAARTAEDASATLDRAGITLIGGIPDGRKKERTATGGSRRAGGTGGTFDWFDALPKREQARLRRNNWVTRDTVGVTLPDEVPELLDWADWADVDGAMAEYVRLTRIVDGCKSLAHRRTVPAWCHQHELAPGFDDYDADLILAPERAVAAAHVELVDVEMADRYEEAAA